MHNNFSLLKFRLTPGFCLLDELPVFQVYLERNNVELTSCDEWVIFPLGYSKEETFCLIIRSIFEGSNNHMKIKVFGELSLFCSVAPFNSVCYICCNCAIYSVPSVQLSLFCSFYSTHSLHSSLQSSPSGLLVPFICHVRAACIVYFVCFIYFVCSVCSVGLVCLFHLTCLFCPLHRLRWVFYSNFSTSVNSPLWYCCGYVSEPSVCILCRFCVYSKGRFIFQICLLELFRIMKC